MDNSAKPCIFYLLIPEFIQVSLLIKAYMDSSVIGRSSLVSTELVDKPKKRALYRYTLVTREKIYADS